MTLPVPRLKIYKYFLTLTCVGEYLPRTAPVDNLICVGKFSSLLQRDISIVFTCLRNTPKKVLSGVLDPICIFTDNFQFFTNWWALKQNKISTTQIFDINFLENLSVKKIFVRVLRKFSCVSAIFVCQIFISIFPIPAGFAKMIKSFHGYFTKYHSMLKENECNISRVNLFCSSRCFFDQHESILEFHQSFNYYKK